MVHGNVPHFVIQEGHFFLSVGKGHKGHTEDRKYLVLSEKMYIFVRTENVEIFINKIKGNEGKTDNKVN